MDARCRIELFGGLRALQGDRVVTRFRTQKTGSLLAYLAFYRHKIHYREILIEILWPGVSPEAGRNSLSVALSSLRQLLEPTGVETGSVLRADRFTVQIEPSAIDTDVADFEAALRASDDLELTRQAVELYHGELLAGYYEEWIGPEQQRLAEQYFSAIQRLSAHLTQAGRYNEAVDYARRAVGVDPLREEFHMTLVRLLAARGRSSDAIRQYREMERLLDQRLGETPSASARALLSELLQGVREETNDEVLTSSLPLVLQETAPERLCKVGGLDMSVRQFPPFKTATGHAGRLPLEFTRFFGREGEIARLTALLGQGSQAPSKDPQRRHSPTPRLITLTGPGGSGKTRLALAVAERVKEMFSGAVWFVPLADLTDPRRICDVIADCLQLHRLPMVEPLERVAEFLNGVRFQKPSALASPEPSLILPKEPAPTIHAPGSRSQLPSLSLLVLDNFEQLVEEGASILPALLERVPGCTCLVTSRRRLAIQGELEFRVAPLPVPISRARAWGYETMGEKSVALTHRHSQRSTQLMQNPSIGLFVDRAQLARGDFQLTADNQEVVAELSRRLEGIPLALELAAARSTVMSPAQMLARLSERADLLMSRQQNIPERHRTLRATLDWSYDLLAPELRRFFAQLSVFRGGWTLEAVEAICAGYDRGSEADSETRNVDVLDYLAQLSDGSLIHAEESNGGLRFRMLEMLREYAWEHLDESERTALRRRHLAFFLALTETANSPVDAREKAGWLDGLETEHDNLRTALQFCVETTDPVVIADASLTPPLWEAGLRLAGALQEFWGTRGHLSEGRKWSEAALSHPLAGKRTKWRANALEGAGALARMQSDYISARALHEAGLSIYREIGDREGIAKSLNNLGNVARQQGDYVSARMFYEESLTVHRETGNRGGIAGPLSNLGNVAHSQGDYMSARALYEEALVINRETGNRAWVALNLNGLGNVAHSQGDYTTARALYEEGLSIRRELGDPRSLVIPLDSLAALAREQGDYAQARAYLTECLALCRQLRIRYAAALCLDNFAALVHAQGSPERAVCLYGAAAGLREHIGAALSPENRKVMEPELNALREALGETVFAAAFDSGRALDWEQAIACALDEECA